MTERYLFGNGPFEGWTSLYPQIRQDLYFVMDDSWDIPADRNERWDNPYYGTARLDTSRFPSFRGTPEERLKALSDSVKGRGWKGLGGWICAQKADTDQDVPEAMYWGDRLREAQAAGIRYWKVDWGRDDHNRQWRENLIAWGRELAPDLTIESAMNPEFISFSDTYRTYDVENITAQTVRIWAQDLAGTEAVDISDRVKVDGSSVVVPGEVIADVGLSAASEGDISDPGLVLVII